MAVLRSLLFNITFFGYGLINAIVMLPWLPASRASTVRGLRHWANAVFWCLDKIIGLRYEVRGLENLPDGPAILASKHQSAWDTGFFFQIAGDPAYVLKKELLRVPMFGWYLAKVGMIAVDRNAGASAMKKMVKDAAGVIKEGRKVVIFPEGTRTEPGEHTTYHPGVAAMDKAVDAPVIPVALNSGLFWGPKRFIKRPGIVTVEFLPALPKGLRSRDLMQQLEEAIETASNRLKQEGETQFLPPQEAWTTHPVDNGDKSV